MTNLKKVKNAVIAVTLWSHKYLVHVIYTKHIKTMKYTIC